MSVTSLMPAGSGPFALGPHQTVGMDAEPHEVERWHFADRYYGITLASAPTSMDLELDDLGPGVGRGLIAIASYDDDSGEITVKSFAEHAVPIGLLEQFLSEAQRCLPSVDEGN